MLEWAAFDDKSLGDQYPAGDVVANRFLCTAKRELSSKSTPSIKAQGSDVQGPLPGIVMLDEEEPMSYLMGVSETVPRVVTQTAQRHWGVRALQMDHELLRLFVKSDLPIVIDTCQMRTRFDAEEAGDS